MIPTILMIMNTNQLICKEYLALFYSMRVRPVYIAIIVILAVIVIMTSSAGSVVLPYSQDTLFSKQFHYEGMEPLTGSDFSVDAPKPDAKKPEKADAKKPEGDDKKPVVQSWSEWLLGKPAPKKEDAKKVEGFESLMPAPYAESKVLDRFSHVSAGPQCVGQSSGLVNSLGGLCLSEEDRQMLTTRGGNV
jgi:hypothetical protein